MTTGFDVFCADCHGDLDVEVLKYDNGDIGIAIKPCSNCLSEAKARNTELETELIETKAHCRRLRETSED